MSKLEGTDTCLLSLILKATPCRNCATVFLPEMRSLHRFCSHFCNSMLLVDSLCWLGANGVLLYNVVTVGCSRWNHCMQVHILGCALPTKVTNLLFHLSQTLLVLGSLSTVAGGTLHIDGGNIGGTRRIVSHTCNFFNNQVCFDICCLFS